MSYESGYMKRTDCSVQAYEVTGKGDSTWYDHNYTGGLAGNFAFHSDLTKEDTMMGFMYGRDGFSKQGICYTVNNQNNRSEIVKAIGFATFEPDTEWKLRTRKGGKSGTLVDTQEIDPNLTKYPGFHTIELDKPFEVANGDSYYVELEFVDEYGSNADGRTFLYSTVANPRNVAYNDIRGKNDKYSSIAITIE